MRLFKSKNLFSTFAVILVVTFVASMFAVTNTTNAQENDALPTFRGTGQIISAHWEGFSNEMDAIDVFFASQLTTPIREDTNGLYIKVRHGSGFEYPSQIAVNEENIVNDGHEIQIKASMLFANRANAAPSPHGLTIVYNVAEQTVRIILDNHHGNVENWLATSFIVCDTTPTVFASVIKEKGNMNTLEITVTEPLYFDFSENTMVEQTFFGTFQINNNAAGIYTVGEYKVYVDTKGNDQIRACYIVV